MFTVLIAAKEHIDAIRQENKLFFEPFLESKELAFCYWNPEGQNLQDAVPGLLDAVGRHKDWRAVIINNCTMKTAQNRNPFDLVDNSDFAKLVAPGRRPEWDDDADEIVKMTPEERKEAWNKAVAQWEAEWKAYIEAQVAAKEAMYQSALEQPFQKLATWLCYSPEDHVRETMKDKQDVHDWAMEQIGRDDQKLSVKLEIWERDQYKRELRIKDDFRKAFVDGSYLNIAYPAEVHCISPRAAENNYFDPEAYWTVHQDSEYSAFADRNMYFDRMRFMVFDMLGPSHRNFRTDYIRFLASVLIFVSNPVPSSAMQARRLYQLEAETDDAPLCTLVTSYDRKLAATYEVIESEMETIRGEIPGELTDKAAEALFCTPKDVAVLLDESCNPEKVIVERDYGLFFDRPENEFHKWNKSHQTSEKALAYIAKQQTRSVRKSVSQLHASSEVTDVNINRLTPLQMDDIREYTDAAEDEMVASIPPDLTDISEYKKRLDQESEKVKKVIGRRMTRKTVAILSAICIGLYLICFLPFLFANGSTVRTVSTAIVLSAAMCGVLGIILLVALFFLRSTIVNAVREYNGAARGIINDINDAMKRFSKYLSASCNVRRGHAVQTYADKNLDEYTKGLRIRKKHQEDIRKRRAQLKESYGDYFGDRSCCDETMCRPYEYDFDMKTEYAYPAPFLSGDCRQIEFVSNGNFVTVPSSYVTRILVRMEEIYEK